MPRFGGAFFELFGPRPGRARTRGIKKKPRGKAGLELANRFLTRCPLPAYARSPLSGRRICLRTDGRATGITFHGLVISTRLLVHGFGISRIGAGCLRSPLGIAHGAWLVRLSHRPFLGGSHTRSVIGILSRGTREAQSERKGGCNDSCLHLRHSFTGVDNGQTFKCPGAALFPADWLPAP